MGTVIALGGILAAVLAIVALAYARGRSAGVDAQSVDQSEETARVETAMAQAAVDAPGSVDALARRVRGAHDL